MKHKTTKEMLKQGELPSYGEFMEQNAREFQSNMLNGLGLLGLFLLALYLFS